MDPPARERINDIVDRVAGELINELDPATVEPVLTARYGPPWFMRDENRVGRINEAWLAAYVATRTRLLYDNLERAFYQYEPETGLWRPRSEERLWQVARDRLHEFSQSRATWLLERLHLGTLRAVVSHLRGIRDFDGDGWGSRPPHVHVANGVIVFDDAQDGGRFEEGGAGGFKPRYFSRNRSPIAYDPEAGCPETEQELIARNCTPDDARMFWQWLGACLSGRNEAQRLLILEGAEGGTGKTTMLTLAQKLIGEHNCAQLRTNMLSRPFELSHFVGRTLLCGSDVDEDFLSCKGAETIKSLVGGDLLEAELKQGNRTVPMRGAFNIGVTTNARLRLGMDQVQEGRSPWRRRLLVISSRGEAPARKIPNYAQRLVEIEGAGILNRALQGYAELRASLRTRGDFTLAESHTQRVEVMLDESNSPRLFIDECLEKREGSDVSSEELIRAYTDHCLRRGWRMVGTREFQACVKDLVLMKCAVTESHSIQRNGRSVRGYRDVFLATEPAEGDPY
jgi:putative DNA primase/helicase